MSHIDPGGVVAIEPVASSPSTTRWRQIAGPTTAWGQDKDGTCTITAPLTAADGCLIVMRQEWPWLAGLPVPGWESGGQGVNYTSGGTFTEDTSVRDPNGSRTVKVVPSTAWGGIVMTVQVTAATTYAVTAQVRGSVATPGYTVELAITWKNASNATISTTSGTASAPPNGTWGTFTAQGAAPAGAVAAEIVIEHSAASPNPYWVGRVDARDTAQPLQSRDHYVNVAPAPVTRKTATGEVAVARRRPGLVMMDSVRNKELGGPFLAGQWWSAHYEGNSPSVQQAWRDVSDPTRFRFVVGAPSAPTGPAQRAEVSCQTGGLMARASTWWWSMAFRVSGPFPSSGWLVLCQVHQTPDGSDYDGSPPFGFFINSSGSLRVARRYDPNATTTSNSPQLVETEIDPAFTPDAWHRVVFRLKFDRGGSGGSSGSLGVWLNGVQKINQTGIPFGYNDTAENYPKFGIYRGVGAGVNVAEFANVELGTTDLTSRITAPLPIEF